MEDADAVDDGCHSRLDRPSTCEDLGMLGASGAEDNPRLFTGTGQSRLKGVPEDSLGARRSLEIIPRGAPQPLSAQNSGTETPSSTAAPVSLVSLRCTYSTTCTVGSLTRDLNSLPAAILLS